jgi:hypothetical protein
MDIYNSDFVMVFVTVPGPRRAGMRVKDLVTFFMNVSLM